MPAKRVHLGEGRVPALRRLLLEACEELTLTLQDPFYRLDTQGGEQLAFQVGVTDEEALPCHLTACRGSIALVSESPPEEPLPRCVAQSGNRDPSPRRPEPTQVVADIRHPTHRDDLDALRAEAAARSSREHHPQGRGVARPLDQYDGGDVCGVTAHSCHVRRTRCWSLLRQPRPS